MVTILTCQNSQFLSISEKRKLSGEHTYPMCSFIRTLNISNSTKLSQTQIEVLSIYFDSTPNGSIQIYEINLHVFHNTCVKHIGPSSLSKLCI